MPQLTPEQSLVCMITVLNRGYAQQFVNLAALQGVTYNLILRGKGTASSKLLAYLGLGETEKDVIFSTMPHQFSKPIMETVEKELTLHKPGSGICFTVPICHIAGMMTERRLRGKCQTTGGSDMEQMFQHNLIMIVANQGFTDEIMDAAKSASAAGGTVLHARGAGLKEAEKFFGVTIQPEKEIILIVAEKEHTKEIMQAVSANNQLQQDARCIVFSLPINNAMGLSKAIGAEEFA